MAIGNVKSSPFSLPTTRPVSTEATPAVGGQAQGFKELQGALKELSNNPILRSLLGESGFDGVKGKGHAHKHHGGHKADKAGGAEKAGGKDSKATSEEGIKKLVDGLKKFVQLLEQMTGKKNETQDGAKGADGAGKTGSGGTGATEAAGGSEGAEGAQAAGGSEAAEGAQAAGGSEAAEGAQQAEGAQEAEEANKDPLSQLMDTLKKIISQLETLMASLTKQQPHNTGIVPEGATTRGTNTGIVPPGAVTGTNTGIVPPGVTEV